eukprot:3540067-Ditylum_brightwellii.AAC.1
MEELKYEISYASRKDLINFDNNAALYCDRIIPGLASLIGRKKAYTVISCLCMQQHYRRQGHGSTNSPTIWLIISSTLFDAHEEKAHCAKFISPDITISVSLGMVSFVDDATGQ